MEKKYKNGLVLGKFLPYTLGHRHLITTAIHNCENVYVMVCSLMSEPIPGHLRYLWIKDEFKDNKNVRVISCLDENPQTPEECESTDIFYNDYWVPSVYCRIEKLDVVFTSELYGDEFAQYLGIKHHLVDLERKVVPVSGTMVRTDPFKMWDKISSQVRHYYKKNIVIMGPESTGKSTMVKKLAEYFDGNYVEEYGRTYCETVKTAIEFNQTDYELIAKTQALEVIKGFRMNPNKFQFIDTEGITTLLFGQLYLPGFESEKIESYINKQKYDLYILLDVDVPWVDDGTRDFPNHRKVHFEMIRQELIKRNLPYVIISGESYEERFESAVAEVKKTSIFYK